MVSLSLTLLQCRHLKMGKVHEISSETHAVIIVLHNKGKLKMSKTCVHNNITLYKETGCNRNRSRSRRPTATTSSKDKFIVLTRKLGRRLTASQIYPEVNKCQLKPVSLATVKIRLRDVKLFGRVAVQKPLLRPQNKMKRMHWALTHKHRTEEDFSKVFGQMNPNLKYLDQNT